MKENITTRREIRSAKEIANKKATYANYFRPLTAVALAAAIAASGGAAAMAATGPTLGPAPTASQIAAAQASAPSETITGITETTNGLNIDVSMSDPATGLQVNTLSDDGAGNYKIQVLATGTTSGNWTNAVGDTYNTSIGANAATVTVTAINGTMVDLDVSLASAPGITPNFTATGSSTGPAPVAPKTDPTATDDAVVLDTTEQTSVTADVLANDTPSPGYTFDAASLMLVNPITGGVGSSQTGNATLNVVNGKIVITAIPNWSGFTQVAYTAKEQWAGAPGTEPAGYTPGTTTGVLKVQVIGAQAVQASPTDCTVQALTGGTGFSVALAVSGGTGLGCDLVAAADSVSIAPDATTAAVNVTANDKTTNSSYTVDPQSIEFRAPDGTFAKDVVYPGQFEVSYDSTTGLTTVKRLGTFSGTPQVLYRETESKLDASGNKLVGGSASALLTMDFAPVPTIPAPVDPVTPAPVVPETTVTVTANTPAPETATQVSRPFADYADTSSDFGSNKASKAASVAPQGNDSSESLAGILIGLGAAGAFAVKARHRKPQKSDVAA